MSPQFVDFDRDGALDIVAGIFDGSPHLVRGSKSGWGPPEQILDRDGKRIALNQWWNFDTKKWERTLAHDTKETTELRKKKQLDRAAREKKDVRDDLGDFGHLTSAIAFDLDGNGTLDLLLGDHASGHVYYRLNEGTAKEPKFTTINEFVLADGKPIDVPGTVATMRLVDWNRDGLMDLAIGGMGDAYSQGEGGGVYVYLNVGSVKVPKWGPPITLLERSKKDANEPTRPDAGLYMDFGDHDGDGDLDMIVGGYSMWTPKPVVLTDAQKQRVGELQVEIAKLDKETQALYEGIDKKLEGLEEAAADKKRADLYAEKRDEMVSRSKSRQQLQRELDPLVPGPKRESFVWLYENVSPPKAQ